LITPGPAPEKQKRRCRSIILIREPAGGSDETGSPEGIR